MFAVNASKLSLSSRRLFSSSSSLLNRAVVYTSNGSPSQVVSAISYPSLPPPLPNTVNLKFILSPINPADVNTVEGVYPSKPTLSSNLNSSGKGSQEEPVFVAGNEGLAQVEDVGEGVTGLQKGNWVVMDKPQLGTWSTSRNVEVKEVIRLPVGEADGLTKVHGATITVNPTTAYNMLDGFLRLQEGDWVIQNGANSAVGKLVIQIAKLRGLNTINLVRSRDNLDSLVKDLEDLGATKVLTYEDLNDKSIRGKVKEWTNGKDIRLALNCVGGDPTTAMSKLLGQNAHLVSYGAMSKKPLSLPTSLFIFKNLACHGFWQTRWSKQNTRQQKEALIGTLAGWMAEGKLKAPEHEIITIPASDSDAEATERIRDLLARVSEGKVGGKKILLQLEGTT
ncbi:trans-2-enoyl- reductase [Moniliophthora roreri MCA 2997]|uniref:enoyl-[acyl-carrier-protein] reductase n=2 Tax=Moniliophthora roreri TaxID=221103 RepID=V2WYG2_MONRO|nr:trans-2-enoyl- reductase [Moniliophthora roreri MCA 2997]KAI3605021.1 trans-2-enoyl-reductase [Moniliophthora roreri]